MLANGQVAANILPGGSRSPVGAKCNTKCNNRRPVAAAATVLRSGDFSVESTLYSYLAPLSSIELHSSPFSFIQFHSASFGFLRLHSPSTTHTSYNNS